MCFLALFCECFISLRVREWWFRVRARRSSYLEFWRVYVTLFGFFCALLFLTYRLGSFLTYPFILRWKTRASCGRKSAKKNSKLRNRSKKVFSFLFLFFVSSHQSHFARAGGRRLRCPREVFLSPNNKLSFSLSLSALFTFFLSREGGVEEFFPHTQPPFLKKRCLFSLWQQHNTFITQQRAKREREREREKEWMNEEYEKSFSLELLIRNSRQNERYTTKSFPLTLLIIRRRK